MYDRVLARQLQCMPKDHSMGQHAYLSPLGKLSIYAADQTMSGCSQTGRGVTVLLILYRNRLHERVS